MQKKLTSMTSALAVCLLSVSVASADARKGEEFFNSMQGGDCKSCHRVDGSKLVGPGLANVMTRHSNEWLKAFLTDPQATWKSEDPETLELKKRVLKTRVPFTVCKKGPMTSDQLQDLIDYLATLDK